jgi:DNA-binding response OmpR family regulator
MVVAWITMRIESPLVEALRAAPWEIKAFVPDEFLPARLSQSGEVDVIVFELANGLWLDLYREICLKRIAPILIMVDLAYAQVAVEAGADDFLVVPAEPTELLLRVSKLARSSHIIQVGNLEIDLVAWRVSSQGHRVQLSPVEFRLLACLAKRAGQMVSHATILEEVWGWKAEYGALAQVKNYVRRLRKKIEVDLHCPQYVITIPGEGYRLRNQKQWEENCPRVERSKR